MKFRAARKSEQHPWYIQMQITENSFSSYTGMIFDTKEEAESYIRSMSIPMTSHLDTYGQWIER